MWRKERGVEKGGWERVCFVCSIYGGYCAVVLYVLSVPVSVRIYWLVVVCVYVSFLFFPVPMLSSTDPALLDHAQVRTKRKGNKSLCSRNLVGCNPFAFSFLFAAFGVFRGGGRGVGRLGLCQHHATEYTSYGRLNNTLAT